MDRDFLIDLFADFGPVTIRPMFSGFGISVDGTNFALSLRAGLFFRADEQHDSAIRSGRLQAVFRIKPGPRPTVASYWQLPERLYDESGRPDGMGAAGLGRSPTRGAAQAPEGKEGR